MSHIEWTEDLNTHIEIIDSQHRRIVDYINNLHDAQENSDRKLVGEVLNDLIEYTVAHFSFEEGFMAHAGYPQLIAHQQIHRQFERRINNFAARHKAGEHVVDELLVILKKWLINHIQNEDRDYIPVVLQSMQRSEEKSRSNLSGILRDFHN